MWAPSISSVPIRTVDSGSHARPLRNHNTWIPSHVTTGCEYPLTCYVQMEEDCSPLWVGQVGGIRRRARGRRGGGEKNNNKVMAITKAIQQQHNNMICYSWGQNSAMKLVLEKHQHATKEIVVLGNNYGKYLEILNIFWLCAWLLTISSIATEWVWLWQPAEQFLQQLPLQYRTQAGVA